MQTMWNLVRLRIASGTVAFNVQSNVSILHGVSAKIYSSKCQLLLLPILMSIRKRVLKYINKAIIYYQDYMQRILSLNFVEPHGDRKTVLPHHNFSVHHRKLLICCILSTWVPSLEIIPISKHL